MTVSKQPRGPIAQNRQLPPRDSPVRRSSPIVMGQCPIQRTVVRQSRVVLPRHCGRVFLLVQRPQHVFHDLCARRMTGIIYPSLPYRLSLRLGRLRHVPRTGVGTRRLHTIGLLHLGCVLDARDILPLFLKGLGTFIIADQLKPDLTESREPARLTLADSDAVGEFLRDEWRVLAFGHFVHGDIALGRAFGEGMAIDMGEELGVH